MDKGAAKTRAVLGGEFDGKAQGAVVGVEGFNSRLHLGGQGLNSFAGIRGEKAIYMHEPENAKVQITVVAGGWWRLSGAARSNSCASNTAGGALPARWLWRLE